MQSGNRSQTIHRVRIKESADEAEVLFLESARIYRLPKTHPRFKPLLSVVHAALKDGKCVSVITASRESDLLESVPESLGMNRNQ